MSEPGHQALLSLMGNCSIEACLQPVLQHGKAAKNAAHRVRCMEYLGLLLQREGGDALLRNRDAIADAIRCGLGDASPEARAFARTCYWAFHRRWEKHAVLLSESLDPSTQRALARERPSAGNTKAAPSTASRPALQDRAHKKRPAPFSFSQLSHSGGSCDTRSLGESGAAGKTGLAGSG